MAFKKIHAFSLVAVLFLGSACESLSTRNTKPDARAELAPLKGNKPMGTVTFTQQSDGVLVEAHFSGLTPGGHGIHIHEHGDCGGLAAEAAGGHFNPLSKPHGMPGMDESHQGDLGNLQADAYGYAVYSYLSHTLKLTGDGGITGLSVVVHESADDLLTQPSGDSGGRIACGVIVAAGR